MESERKALGLEGVLFRYFTCSACGNASIFVDVHALKDETPEAFAARRAQLEAAVKQSHGEGVEAVLVDK
jgi:hypothetical protein